jgi:phage-related protein
VGRVGTSKDNVSEFPAEVWRRVGEALWVAQIGRKAPYAKPLKALGDAAALKIVRQLRR